MPLAASKEWAADWNILRLHDAKHKTTLADATPVACQKCHYSPALDLAHLGPVGPGASANGKEQTIHRSNSRVIHTFHGNLDLFKVTMPKPNSVMQNQSQDRQTHGKRQGCANPEPDLLSVPSRPGYELSARSHVQWGFGVPGLPWKHEERGQ